MELTDEPPPKTAAANAARAAKKAKRDERRSTAPARGRMGGHAKAQKQVELRQALSSLDNETAPLPALPMATRANHPWAGKLSAALEARRDETPPKSRDMLPVAVKHPMTPSELREAYDAHPSSCSLPSHAAVLLRARPATTEGEQALERLDPVVECANCQEVYEAGLHVFEGALWLAEANSASQCRGTEVHVHLLEVYARAVNAAARGELRCDAAGARPRISIEICWWCSFAKRALAREAYLRANVLHIINQRELPKQFLNAVARDGFIHLGAVFETSPLAMCVNRRVARGPDGHITDLDNGLPRFTSDGRLELIRPHRPTVCAAIVVMEAPLFNLFSGFADVEKQIRGMSIGTEEINAAALEFFEFSRRTVTEGVAGDTRVEMAFLVAARSNGAQAAREWRDEFHAKHADRSQHIADALTPEQFPPTVTPPREILRSLQSKLLVVEHFDGAKVTAPKEAGNGGMEGSLHLAATQRRASEACARATIAKAREAKAAKATNDAESSSDTDGSSDDAAEGGEARLEAQEDVIENLSCSLCGSGKATALNDILICDSCGRGEHMHCQLPRLFHVPANEWFCSECSPQLLPFLQPAPPRSELPDFGADVLQGDAGPSGRGGEFVGSRAVALFAAHPDVRAAALDVDTNIKYVFPLPPAGGPEKHLGRVGIMRPIQPGRSRRVRQDGTKEGCASQGLPGVYGSVYPGKQMTQLSGGRDVALAATDPHFAEWLDSMALSRLLALAAAKDLGLLDTDPTTTAGDLFGGAAKTPNRRGTKRAKMGKYDPFVVAFAQLELACAAAKSLSEVVSHMRAVRMSRNREYACVHLDSSKRGFSSSIEFWFVEFAKMAHADRQHCRAHSKPEEHEVLHSSHAACEPSDPLQPALGLT